MPHQVVTLCFDGLVAFDLTAPAQAFQLAAKPSGGPLYEFSTCSPGGASLQTTSGFSVVPDGDLRALGRAQTIVVPGYAAIFEPPPAEVLDALRAAPRRGEARGCFPSAPAPSGSPTPASSTGAARPRTGPGPRSWRAASRPWRSTPTLSSSTRERC